MLLEVLSILGPVIYWMGFVQGDRKLDGLARWDGSLTSLVIPPHLLQFQQVVDAEVQQYMSNFDSSQTVPLTNSTNTSSTLHTAGSNPGHFYPYIYFGIAITAVLFATLLAKWIQTHIRSPPELSAFRNLKSQIQNSLQPLVKNLIQKYQSTNAANKCYSDLTDVLHDRIGLLKRWIELLNADNKRLEERVDLLNTDANTKDFPNIDTTSSGPLPDSHDQMDDNSRQVPPTAESETHQFEALKGQRDLLEETVKVKDREIEKQEGMKTSAQARVQELEGALTVLQGELTAQNVVVKGQRDVLEETVKVKDLEIAKQDALAQTRVQVLERDLTTAQARIRGFERDLTTAKTRVQELEGRSVAGEVAKRSTVPARPPKPENKATPVTHALPPRPSFDNKTPAASPASNPGSSPGADLLPSLLRGSGRPKGSVPPLLPHHQSFGAKPESSSSVQAPPFRPGYPFFTPGSADTSSSFPSPPVFRFPSTPVPAQPSLSMPTPLFQSPPPQSILTTTTIGATKGPSLFSNYARPKGPSLFGVFPPQSARSQDPSPSPGLSTQKHAKEVVNPFEESFFEENKPASESELASRAIKPMRKRKIVVSKAWPHARQTVGETSWHTEESVSWPHGRQVNGKPEWR